MASSPPSGASGAKSEALDLIQVEWVSVHRNFDLVASPYLPRRERARELSREA